MRSSNEVKEAAFLRTSNYVTRSALAWLIICSPWGGRHKGCSLAKPSTLKSWKIKWQAVIFRLAVVVIFIPSGNSLLSLLVLPQLSLIFLNVIDLAPSPRYVHTLVKNFESPWTRRIKEWFSYSGDSWKLIRQALVIIQHPRGGVENKQIQLLGLLLGYLWPLRSVNGFEWSLPWFRSPWPLVRFALFQERPHSWNQKSGHHFMPILPVLHAHSYLHSVKCIQSALPCARAYKWSNFRALFTWYSHFLSFRAEGQIFEPSVRVSADSKWNQILSVHYSVPCDARTDFRIDKNLRVWQTYLSGSKTALLVLFLVLGAPGQRPLRDQAFPSFAELRIPAMTRQRGGDPWLNWVSSAWEST